MRVARQVKFAVDMIEIQGLGLVAACAGEGRSSSHILLLGMYNHFTPELFLQFAHNFLDFNM
jgi:hypothetical protein